MKILHLLKSLHTGGSVTYMLKLSAGLIARGNEVVVAAGTDDARPALEAMGARFHRVTMSDLSFFSAAGRLAEIIRDEGVDVINAHHWTAGAAGYLAGRLTGVPFLLTVHGTRRAYQRWLVFYWSPKVLVVSARGRDNLIHDMGLAPERIIESFIGVDVQRFAPGPPDPALLTELGLDADTPVVLHVSRLNATKGHVARVLAKAAPGIATSVPDVTVLIAGDGEDRPRVDAAAATANAAIGRQAVRLLGMRGDVPALMRLARAVVGTASVAMEALASGVPVVAAGKYGYVGPVTPDTFDAANAVCFGDHAAPQPLTPEALAEALPPLLDDDTRRELGAWGRALMVEQYSVERMVDQVEAVYEEIRWGR
ncbi:MAG: Spore coat protein SA [bacterium ADurb.Bin429]|nr:MAG: Spore coat protein SA [bacterium ADurb.Bin429]